ncbi:MAG: FAD-dependent monooxygenase, partial [Asticcacaulis sp.]
METEQTCDVIISGGGMAGMTLALALHSGGLDVVLVEKQPFDTQLDASFDGRASAIAYACFRQWKALGVGDALEPLACRMDEIFVTDGRLPGAATPPPLPFFLHFTSDEISGRSGDEPLGYMVENRHTRRALHEAMTAQGIKVVTAGVTAYREGPGFAEVDLDTGETLRAPLVVSAEGRKSRLREQAGIGYINWDYGQSAVVATVQMARPHNHVAYEHFLPTGPFA